MDREQIRVIFLGASNVSMEAAILADFMGFQTICIDEDASKLTAERFGVSERTIVESMEDLSSIEVRSTDMICVITRGHTFDRQCFTWALGTDAYYVGMMGSAKKNNKCFNYALEHGVSQERIDWAYAPIGIGMECADAREIALSIVAQLVQVRSNMAPGELDHDLLHQE